MASSNFSRSSRNSQRLPISEEAVFDTAAALGFGSPAEEFSLAEQLVLPQTDEFFAKKQLDPWRRMSALEHDCILVVEFSELEGPKPSLCIPDSPGAHFERNDFSVWLMTADYQASNHRGGPFFINEDIQMLVSNEEQGVHTYAHHFTLFDIEARGYVRPFCATYVTPDSDKLTRLFDSLRSEFSNILRTVKTCNRRQFRKALTEAVEALNVIETQAISSYYELYYDGKLDPLAIAKLESSNKAQLLSNDSSTSSPSHSSKQQQQKPDVLNMRYRRLQRELIVAQNVVAEDLRSKLGQIPSTSTTTTSTVNGVGCTSHFVNMDQWINSLRRGEGVDNHRKTLKEFHELCPCVFDEFQRQMRSTWMKYRHWNTSASWLFEPTSKFGAKVNFGSIPFLYVPPSPSSTTKDENLETRKSRNRRIDDFSVTEVDALHNLIYSKNQRGASGSTNEDEEQKRLLMNVAPHLRYFLYPILTGQLLIAYGSDLRRQLIIDLIQKLKFFIPTIFAAPRCSVWNDNENSTTISESALSDYKIMGMRVGQKEKIADFINDDTRRYVALLDLNDDIFHVPDYKGDILNRLMSRTSSHKSDWTLMLAVLTSASDYAQLAYVLCYTTFSAPKFVSNTNNGFLSFPKWKSTRGSQKLKDAASILKLQNGDLKIARYLVELLKLQQEDSQQDGKSGTSRDDDERGEQFEDGLLLEYEPAHLHKL